MLELLSNSGTSELRPIQENVSMDVFLTLESNLILADTGKVGRKDETLRAAGLPFVVLEAP